MREIGIFKALLIYFGLQLLVITGTLIFFGEDINLNIISLIVNLSTIFVIFKCGKINKSLITRNIENFKKKFNFKEIIIVVLTQILISVSLGMIISSVEYINNPTKAIEMMSEQVIIYNNFLELLLVGFITTILVPVTEELIFRRIIFSKISKKRGVLIGAILSSSIFGILHIDLAVLGAIIFGVTCCIVYLKYDNILIPISVHIINNGIGVIMEIVDFFLSESSVVDYTMTGNDIKLNLIIGGILLIMSATMFGAFLVKNKNYLTNKNNNNSECLES